MEVPFFAARNGSWIRATPAFDGKTLYVAGMRDLLVALDAQTGREIWRRDFVSEGSTLPTFGFVSSPLIDGGDLYIQAGGACQKLDAKTGKTIWKSLSDGGGMMGSAFSSPMFGTLSGERQLLVQTRLKLAGLRPSDGTVLWERPIPAFRGMNILTPQPHGKDTVFTSSHTGGTRVIRVQSGEKWATAEVWSSKYEGYMTSPVIISDYAYWLGKDQRFVCANVTTGEEAWRSEKRFGQYMSLIASGDKIFGLDQRGLLFLFKANSKEFEPLGELKVAETECWAHLAITGDQVWIRDSDSIRCWQISTKSEK
jgi:outer membrane protein assembly factor BamB